MAGLITRRQDNGAVLISLTTRITRRVGQFTASGTNGSFNIPAFEGEIWFYARYPLGYADSQGTRVYLSGRTIVWEWLPYNVQIIYGAY